MATNYNSGRYSLLSKNLNDGAETYTAGHLENGEGNWEAANIFVDKDKVYRPHPDGPNGPPMLLGTITNGVALSPSGQFMFELKKATG